MNQTNRYTDQIRLYIDEHTSRRIAQLRAVYEDQGRSTSSMAAVFKDAIDAHHMSLLGNDRPPHGWEDYLR